MDGVCLVFSLFFTFLFVIFGSFLLFFFSFLHDELAVFFMPRPVSFLALVHAVICL